MTAQEKRSEPGQKFPAAPAPPPAAEAAPAQSLVPDELAQAWIQFMRNDVAQSVNALNNRLNAILAAVREIQAEQLSPAALRELENIQVDLSRMANITSQLLRRVDLMAPDTVPHMLAPYQAAPTRRGHIVVVEDDPANRAVITRLFQRLGHLVTPCANGLEGIEVLKLGPVDCVICDLRMPALGGRGFFEQVEELMPHLASRFVFVTGDYTDPTSRKFLEKSGQPVVAKPYEVSELLAAVAVILRGVAVLVEAPRPTVS